MRIFAPFLILFSVYNIGSAQADTAEYHRYENENVGQFRKKIDFTQPVVDLPDSPADPVVHVNENNDPSDTIRVTWNIPDALVKMYDMHHPPGEAQIEGYRVQIYAGPNYETAKKIKAEFIQAFPDENVYDTWESPHFRVRTGDFLSRNEALTFSNRIKEKFAGAFVVPDKIKMRKSRKTFSPEVPPGEIPED